MKKNSRLKKGSRGLTVLLLTLTFAPLKSRADVDTREGSFKFAERDGPIERSYYSRSHHRGVFGFRWCSPLDEVLPKLEAPATEKCPLKQSALKNITRIAPDQFKVVTTNKKTLTVTFDPELFLVTEIADDVGHKTTYRYSRDDLKSVDGSGAPKSSAYDYDLSHNLTATKKDGVVISTLKYDLVYDRVTDLDYGDGCSDHFAYNDKKSVKSTIRSTVKSTVESTTVTRTCHGLQRFANTYEFTERRSPADAGFHLIRFRIYNPIGVQTEVSYE